MTVVPKPEVSASYPASAASTPEAPASYPVAGTEEPTPNSSLVPVASTAAVPTYPTAAAVIPSGYSNGTATSSAQGAVGTGSSTSLVLSITGYPTASPSLISANAGTVLGVKAWGMGVVALIGAALVL